MANMHRTLPLVVALLAAAASSAAAQLVRGSVRAADSTPIAGAIVTLLRANGTPAARAYSRENGYFEVRAPGEGRYGVSVDRLGYERAPQAPVDVAGLVTTAHLVPESKRHVLGVGPSIAATCRVGFDLHDRAAALWDVVQNDLAAVVTVENGRQFVRQVARTQRTLDVDGKKVLEERAVPEMRVSERSFLVPTADSIAKVGYVHGDSSYYVFESPDARIVLGDAFRAAHCFSELPGERIVAGRAQVGLAFQPIGAPTITEIGGTFWVDRDAAVLAELEWAYVPAPAKKGSYGGSQIFKVAEKQRVLYLESWSQRMPVFTARRSLESKAKLTVDKQLRFTQTVELQVASIREEGGRVTKLP